MLRKRCRNLAVALGLTLLISTGLHGKASRLRAMWRSDPASSMVIGWDQESGANPVLFYDQADFGTAASAYRYSSRPHRTVEAKGMNNHFVRLEGLRPATVYYFVIRDSEGTSRRFSFRTSPATPDERLSIIAGGDSRNNRGARLSANRLVSKLRPHCVIFDGDMTNEDNDEEWREWFDDWQATIGADGRLFPIIPARGNHEQDNFGIFDLFDVPNAKAYYGLSLGGDLLRVITLNSNEPAMGEQLEWLQSELQRNQHAFWRFVQYHHAIRPHTARKEERNEQYLYWAPLFHQYRVQAVLESDAHVVKCTYPIRPSMGPGSEEGFIRDDQNGTVYMGEGCWGSPLRTMDDAKSWTRHAGMFNQFKWIFVDREKMEVRTIMTDISEQVAEVPAHDPYQEPLGLVVWNPNREGVVRIEQGRKPADGPLIAAQLPAPAPRMKVTRLLAQEQTDGVAIRWSTEHESPQCQFELQRFQVGRGDYLTLSKANAKGLPANDYLFIDRESLTGAGRTLRYRLKCFFPDGATAFEECQVELKARPAGDWSQFPLAPYDPREDRVILNYRLDEPAMTTAYILDAEMKEQDKVALGPQAAGTYRYPLSLSRVPKGAYLVILMAGRKPISRYRIVKP